VGVELPSLTGSHFFLSTRPIAVPARAGICAD
jgi:hypothetical protein